MKETKDHPSSRHFLEEVSRYCSSQLTLYQFNRTTLDIDEKYREGRITSLNYIADLTFYFMQQERQIIEVFIRELDKQAQMVGTLKPSQYRQGIRDSIEALRREIGEEIV